ncbi:hypothetical protein DC498_06280 [Terrimonas sp.]|nr:hypothetical protein DC498_06280 [Terrimonas sp.]
MIAIILGLGVAQLLKNTIKLINHPRSGKAYPLHLAWTFFVFLLIILFWWWEARLHIVKNWTVLSYLFLIAYTTLYYALSVLIFPDEINDYKSYKEYFFSRKKWFFSFLILVFIIDIADTLLKGENYLKSLGNDYILRVSSHILLFLTGIYSYSQKFHYFLVGCLIVYNLVYIFKHYYYI